MSRLLFDARPLAEYGGVSRVTARVLAHVRRTRPDAEIVTVATGWKRSKNDIHLRLPNKLWSLLVFLGLTSLDRAVRAPFDELILPNVGFVGTPKIPYTVVVHDLSFIIEPRWFSFRMRVWHRAVRATRLIQRATHVWCVSHATADDVARLLHVPRERMTVLPHDIVMGTIQKPTTKPSVRPAPYVLAFTGSRRKNINTAVAAFARLKQDARFASLRLLLIGAYPVPFHLHPPWLTTIPFLTDRQLHDVYQNASAFLYPSWYEGFGLPLHEAAAFGIPILASAHGALPETAPPGTILIPPAKPHLWATALRQVLK
jgi:glycosyltransferase involved in cell wall biosynthesis